MAGFRVDRGLADVFRSVDASERQMFPARRRRPFIFMRIATTLSVLARSSPMAAARTVSHSLDASLTPPFAAIIVLALIGTAFFGLMSWIERMISWKREGSDSTHV